MSEAGDYTVRVKGEETHSTAHLTVTGVFLTFMQQVLFDEENLV